MTFEDIFLIVFLLFLFLCLPILHSCEKQACLRAGYTVEQCRGL